MREGLIDCPCCDGSGEVCVGAEAIYEAGCGFSHTEPVMAPCHDCEGTGQIMEECETAGEEPYDGTACAELQQAATAIRALLPPAPSLGTQVSDKESHHG